MPSVCNGHAPVVATEGTELSLAKMVVSYIEKKYRNLDKRKAKLDGYHQKEKEGESLNKDQKEALSFRAHVAHTVETLKELLDQVTAVATEEEKKADKLQKKQLKRQQIETHKERVNLICELFTVQQTLRSAEDGNTKLRVATVLTAEESGHLEKLRELIMPPAKSGVVSFEKAELATSYLEAREGEYAGCSFQAFRDVLRRVRECSCYTADAEEKKDTKEVEEVKTEPEVKVETQSVVEAPVEEKVLEELELHPAPSAPPQEPEVDIQLPIMAEAPVTIELPAPRTAAKKPQEIISSFRGNYNFLQESEIDENEPVVPTTFSPVSGIYNPYSCAPYADYNLPDSHAGLLTDDTFFYVSDMVQNTAAPVGGLYNPYGYIAHGDFAAPQSHAPMVGGMMSAQHVPFTAYENQPAMYVPLGYNEHMSAAGYTLVSSYTAPIVSHEQCVIQDLTEVETSGFEVVSVNPESGVESSGLDEAGVSEEHGSVEREEAAADAEAQKTFSMNPNADVFHSKNFPEGAGMMQDNTQGCYNGKNRGRGGRGNPGGFRGHRGGNYNGQGGGYPRYPRNDGYRPDGQNGYNPEYNNGWRGPRRGNRGGNGRGGYGRGGHGGYDRNAAQQPITPEAQD